jgi:ABC-type lipoprotein release transport system permease subunit
MSCTGWVFRTPDYLMSDLRLMVKSKTVGQTVMFTVLFLLAMLAIFDTQVLSVFRRRREIGMLVALGMTKARVILLFTLEGALHSILAALLGLAYGAPLFWYLGRYGFGLPGGESWGYALGDRLYPAFTAGLILGTTLLVFVVTAFVAWLPTRRIARLKPTDALAGRGN